MGVPIDRGLTQIGKIRSCFPNIVEMGVPIDRGLTQLLSLLQLPQLWRRNGCPDR